MEGGVCVVIANLYTVPLKSGSSHKVLLSLLELLISTPTHSHTYTTDLGQEHTTGLEHTERT